MGKINIVPHPPDVIEVSPEILATMKHKLEEVEVMKFCYEILDDRQNLPLLVKDVGHDQGHTSLTNSAKELVNDLISRGLLPLGRKLFYIDSMGILDEMVRDESGYFLHFRSGGFIDQEIPKYEECTREVVPERVLQRKSR